MSAHRRRAVLLGVHDHGRELCVVAAVVGHLRRDNELLDGLDGLRVVALDPAAALAHDATVWIGEICPLS